MYIEARDGAYCYICDNLMENTWVCHACIKAMNAEQVQQFFTNCGSLPERFDLNVPLPEWVVILRRAIVDPDLRMDVGL